jgi:hypothetical protein
MILKRTQTTVLPMAVNSNGNRISLKDRSE